MADIIEKRRLLVGLKADDSTQDSLLLLFWSQAERKVIKARYPYGYNESQKANALSQYADNIEQIYIYLWNKQGAEGETSHNENGVSRTYENAGIPSSFLADIVPCVGVF